MQLHLRRSVQLKIFWQQSSEWICFAKMPFRTFGSNADAGAEAPLLQLPFVPQGVAAKVSDTTMLISAKKRVPKSFFTSQKQNQFDARKNI
jgi:hypothetical protein